MGCPLGISESWTTARLAYLFFRRMIELLEHTDDL